MNLHLFPCMIFEIFFVLLCGYSGKSNCIDGSPDFCNMSFTTVPTEVDAARSSLLNTPPYPVSEPLPRISLSSISHPEFISFREGHRPFILTESISDWKALDRWPINLDSPGGAYLAKLFRSKIAEFYPFNHLTSGTFPYLMYFRSALFELLRPTNRFPIKNEHVWACENGCREIELQLTPAMGRKLEKRGDIIPNRKDGMPLGTRWWMKKCMKKKAVQKEFHLKNFWDVLFISSKGSGIFAHSDSIPSASWIGQIQGRRYWRVCSQTKDDDYANEQKDNLECFESVVHPGEVLFHPGGWQHQYQNLDTPTIAITGTAITSQNFQPLTDKFLAECSRHNIQYNFSAVLCDALDECYQVWQKNWAKLTTDQKDLPSWRTLAPKKVCQIKDSIPPTNNNYDGRNSIVI